MRPSFKFALVFLLVTQGWATPIKEEPAVAAPVAAVEQKEPVAEAAVPPQPVKVKDAPVQSDEVEHPAPAEAQPAREARDFNNVDTLGEREQALLTKLNLKCSQREVSSCVMLKMVTYINKLLKKSNIQVTEGLEISQSAEMVEEEMSMARGMDSLGESEEGQVSQLVANKLWAFVRSRSLRWNVFPEADVVLSATPDKEGSLNLGLSVRTAKAIEMARKKNNMGPLLAAGVMKLGLIGGVAFKALSLLVGKALILSKIAFLLGAILWLKKLFSQQRHVTYEVVSHPHHSHSHVASDSHGHSHDSYSGSGWGRQLGAAPAAAAKPQAAHNLAYSAYAPAASTASSSAAAAPAAAPAGVAASASATKH